MVTDRNSIVKELISFSMPLILSGILQQLYNWTDAFIIGHAEGELQLGAIGATSPISVFLINAMIGFTVGLSILAAQEFGRGNKMKITSILADFQPLLFGVLGILSVIAMVFSRVILTWMDTPVEIFEYGLSYLRIIFLGVPFLAVYNLYAGLLRATGDTKAAFYAVLLSVGMNVIADTILIVVFPFGVVGAAVATLFSQAAMALFITHYARKKYPDFMMTEKNQAERFASLKDGLSFGTPPALQNSVTSLGNLVLQNFMNGFGALTVLSITTAYRVDSIMLLPIINLGSAISSLVARAKGAEDRGKIENYLKTGLVMMILVAGVLALIMYFFGALFVAVFGVSGEALDIGAVFFRDLSVFYVLFGVSIVFRSVLEGIGDLKYCSMMGIATLLLRIVLSYILKPFLWERTIAFAEGITWIVLFVVMALRVWHHRKEILEGVEDGTF